MKRKLLAILLVVFMGMCSVAYAVDIPDATPNFFVNDFAGIFSDEDIEIMMERAVELDQNYDGIQVVVTTVKTIGNVDLGVYANRMYNKYGIGKNDMGVLLLVVTEDRLIRAETGNMMQTYIPDSLIAKIQNEFAIPYLREYKFAEGMMSFQEATINTIKQRVVIADEPIINVEDTPKETENNSDNDAKIVLWVLAGIFSIGAILAYICEYVIKPKKVNKQEAKPAYKQLEEMLASAEQKNYEYIQQINDSDHKNDTLSVQLNAKQEENQKLKAELARCKEMIENVYALHPNIEEEINELLANRKKEADKLAAEAFDSFAVKRIALPSSIDNLDAFRSVLNKYEALTNEQKTYVKTDIDKLKDKYEESVRLKKEEDARLAREVEMREAEVLKNKIEQELRREIIPERDYCDGLERLMKQYNGMSEEARGIFSFALMNEFSRRIFNANDAAEEEERRRRREEEERRRREEEERRRREEERRHREEEERRRRQRAAMSSYSRPRSSSSFGSGSRSSFGGFSGRGGRSSGGGASGSF